MKRGRNAGNVCTTGCKSLTECRGHVALLGSTCQVSTDAEVLSGPEGVALTVRWAVILYYLRPEGFPNTSPQQAKFCVKHPVRHPLVIDSDFDEDGRSIHLPNDQGEQEFLCTCRFDHCLSS